MHASSAPLTFGELLGRAVEMYRAHGGVFLRAAAIFYVPVALLFFFWARGVETTFLASVVAWPVTLIADLALVSLCIELLHGRPLAVRAAVGRGLRRLLAYAGMVVVMVVAFGAAAVVAAIPFWFEFTGPDFHLSELRYDFLDLVRRGDVEGIGSAVGDVAAVGIGLCLVGGLFLILIFYLSTRWLVAEVALMVEETGPLESLKRSWKLSQDYVLRTAGLAVLLSVALIVVDSLSGTPLDLVVGVLLPAADNSLKTGLGNAISNLLSVVTTPFYICSVVLYYFDLRVRKERYDFFVTPDR